MEPVDSLRETEGGFVNGLKTNAEDTFGICDGMNTYKKVKEETADCLEMSHEFKAELDESTGEAEFESIPWMKQECGDWYKVPMKQEWSETYSVTTPKRRFGCERKPVDRTERLGLDKQPHCRPVHFEGEKQLLRQIHGLASSALGSDAGGTSRSSRLSSSEVAVRGGRSSAAGQEIRQDLNESDVKTADDTGATCNAQRLVSDIHLGSHSTECRQKSLLGSSQVADEAERTRMDDAVHSESSKNSVMDSIKWQTAVRSYPSFAVDAEESHLTKHASWTMKMLNEISDDFSDDHQAGKKPFKCSVCQRTFNSNSNLSRHKKIHTGEKPFECSVCRKNFARKPDLILHVRFHTGEKPFECNVCRKKFTQKSHLTSHARSHTGEKPFECSVCRKKFIQKSNLNWHVKIHTGEKPFECNVCRKRFTRNSDLTLHVGVHTGEKPYECSLCRKNFTRKSDLISHVRFHTGEKPFECSICRKKFAGKLHLTKHLIIHAGGKLFECSVCKKKFTQKSNLTLHARIHTGEKQFECNVCGKKFTQKSHLTSHVIIHTGEKPFDCNVCRKKFTRKSHLTSHIRIHA